MQGLYCSGAVLWSSSGVVFMSVLWTFCCSRGWEGFVEICSRFLRVTCTLSPRKQQALFLRVCAGSSRFVFSCDKILVGSCLV